MHPMMKLLIDNRKKGEFRAEHHSNDNEATLYVYDVIVANEFEAEFWGGVAPESFVKTLNGINAETIHLRINSPGGNVFAARSMEQALREHSAKIIVHIDGLAASAASFLSMGADEIIMNQGAFFMIHKGMTGVYGNTDDLMHVAEILEKVDGTLITTYQNRTQQDRELIAEWLTNETWFTAEEAVELGFANRIEEGVKVENKAWNLDAYEHAPGQQAEPANKNTIQMNVGVIEQDEFTKSVVAAVTDAINKNNTSSDDPHNTELTDEGGDDADLVVTNTDQMKRHLDLKTVA